MKKTIVYITTLLPYPPDMGGKIKTLSTLKNLVRTNDVHLFSFVDKPEDLKYEKNLYEVGIKKCTTIVHGVIAEKHRVTQLLILFKSLFTLRPYSVYKYYSSQMVQLLNCFLSKNKIDILWVDHTIQTQYLPTAFCHPESRVNRDEGSRPLSIFPRDSSPATGGIRMAGRPHTVLETHNFKTDFFRDMFLAEGKLFWKLFSFYDWMKFRFYEPRELKKFDLVYAISEKEKEKISRFNRNVKVLIPDIKPTGNKANMRSKKLFFVGLLTWYPNKQGITWFIEKIFPKLKEEIPEITLDVVGDYSTRWKPPEHEGVKFYGYQKNLRPFWKNASVFIVPLWYGSGIRIKILEALANGIPVVSTSKGAEGLPDEIKKKIFIEDTPQNLIRTIQKLLYNLTT